MTRRSYAYYSRADSFSRSYNAEVAEEEGRLPRSRAAAHFGLSTTAFDAGCVAANYRPSEWHHVGRYAAMVDYYDCELLAADPRFWEGAAAAYKTAARRALVKARQASYAARTANHEAVEIAANRASIRTRLHNQWTQPVPVHKHDSRKNWLRFVSRAFEAAGCPYHSGDSLPWIANGDFATLRAKIEDRTIKLTTPPEMTPQRWEKRVRAALAEAGHRYPKHNRVPQVPIGDEIALAAMIEAKRNKKK